MGIHHTCDALTCIHLPRCAQVRVLQERLIDNKRRRPSSGMESPVRADGASTPERVAPPTELAHVRRSPLHAPVSSGSMSTRGGLVAPPRVPTPLGSPARLRGSGSLSSGLGSGSSGGLGGSGGLGARGAGLGGSDSARRVGFGSSLQPSATPMGSRLGTPIHRSGSGFLSPPPALGGGGLGGGGLGAGWGGRR